MATPAISTLEGSDWSQLREQVATIQALLRRKYQGAQLNQSMDDLALLQRIVNDKVYDEFETDAHRAIGAAFGNVIERQLAFEWVALDDAYGREPGLRLKTQAGQPAPLTVHPLRLVANRIANGSKVDFVEMFKVIKADVAKTRLI